MKRDLEIDRDKVRAEARKLDQTELRGGRGAPARTGTRCARAEVW